MWNREDKRELNVVWNGNSLSNTTTPVYMGVHLDRTMCYKTHIEKSRWGHLDDAPSVDCDCGEPHTMYHRLSCRLLDDCTTDDLATVTERAKACARKWEKIVWRAHSDFVAFPLVVFLLAGPRVIWGAVGAILLMYDQRSCNIRWSAVGTSYGGWHCSGAAYLLIIYLNICIQGKHNSVKYCFTMWPC